MFKRELA